MAAKKKKVSGKRESKIITRIVPASGPEGMTVAEEFERTMELRNLFNARSHEEAKAKELAFRKGIAARGIKPPAVRVTPKD